MTQVPAIEGGNPTRSDFLPFQRPWTGEAEEREVIEAIRSGWMTMGPRTIAFEHQFAEYLGCRHAVSVNSCTAALHLGLVLNGLQPGDEVITTPITFASTVNTIVHERAVPVFVDIEPDTLNLDADKIESKITPRTKGIVPVHFCGHPCAMTEISALAQKYGLFVVEDAAHAVGARYENRNIGTISPITCFSFYATKNMTTGEGGMLTTDNEELAQTARCLRLHGMSLDAWKRYGASGFKHWEIVTAGYKYNLTDIQSAIGIHQLKRLDEFNLIRQRYRDYYIEAFNDSPELEFLTVRENVLSSHHMFVVKLRTELLTVSRDRILDAIQAENVGVGIHFTAVHLHPFYRQRFGFSEGVAPIAEDVSGRILSLPLYPRLTQEDLASVVTAVKKVLAYYRK